MKILTWMAGQVASGEVARTLDWDTVYLVRRARFLCMECGDDPEAEFSIACQIPDGEPDLDEGPHVTSADASDVPGAGMTDEEFQAVMYAAIDANADGDADAAPLQSLAQKEAVRRGYEGWREAHMKLTMKETGKDS